MANSNSTNSTELNVNNQSSQTMSPNPLDQELSSDQLDRVATEDQANPSAVQSSQIEIDQANQIVNDYDAQKNAQLDTNDGLNNQSLGEAGDKHTQNNSQDSINSFINESTKNHKLKTIFKSKKTLLVILFGLVLIFIGFLLLISGNKKHDFKEVSLGSLKLEATKDAQDGIDRQTAFSLVGSPLSAKEVEKNLTVTPEIDFAVKEQFGSLLIEPKHELLANTSYTFSLKAPEMEDVLGLWAFQTQGAFQFRSSLPGNQANSVPVNTSIELSFNSDLFEDIEKFVTFEPSIQGSWERYGQTAVFIPNQPLNYATLYQIKIAKEFGLSNTKNTLGKDIYIQFETEAQEETTPQLIVPQQQIWEITPGAEPKLPIQYNSQNSPVNIKIYKYSAGADFATQWLDYQKIPAWSYLTRRSYVPPVDNLMLVGESEVTPISNQFTYMSVLPIPFQLDKGWYLVIFTSPTNPDFKTFSWIQSSNLSAYVNYSDTKSLVWSIDKISNAPASQANVYLVDSSQQLATTDADGLAVFNTPSQLLEGLLSASQPSLNLSQKAILLEVKKDDNSIYLPGVTGFQDGYYSGATYYQRSGLASANNWYWTYGQTDKPIYQAGEKVEFWGYVRPRDDQRSKPKELVAKISGYDIGLVAQSTAPFKVSDSGTFKSHLQLPAGVVGYFSIDLYEKDKDEKIASIALEVNHYRKPTFDLTTNLSKRAAFVGESVELNGKMSFFDGTPISNTKIELSKNQGGESFKQELLTNQSGEFNTTINLEDQRRDEQQRKKSAPFRSYFTVQPGISAEALTTSEVDLAVFPSTIVTKGEITTKDRPSANLSFYKTDLTEVTQSYPNFESYAGEPVKDLPLRYKVERVWYEKIPDGEYYDEVSKTVQLTYRSEVRYEFITEGDAVSDQNGQVKIEFDGSISETYRVQYQFSDTTGRLFEEEIQMWTPTNMGNTEMIELKSGLEQSGSSMLRVNSFTTDLSDNIPISIIRNGEPIAEANNNKFLLWSANRGLLSIKVQNSSGFQMPFTKESAPSMMLTGVWYDGFSFKVSYPQQWNYDRELARLNINISNINKAYDPAEKFSANLKVTDKDGKGVKADVGISVIDKALLDLRDRSTNILDQIYRATNPGVFFSYYTHKVTGFTAAEGGGGCFKAGTLILMADGSQKPIELIKAGDLVKTRDLENSNNLINVKVLKTHQTLSGEYLIINNNLEVTPEHILRVNNSWRVANSIQLGDMLENSAGEAVIVESVKRIYESNLVYNLSVESPHTFIANGIYVHNEKGDRSVFKDVAFFDVISTDNQGNAKIETTLPDDITTWSMQAEAVQDRDLPLAGDNNAEVIVTAPLVVVAPIAGSYLEGDEPILVLRSFGTALKTNDQVEYFIQAPTLGITEEWKQNGEAFLPKNFQLPALKSGTHKLIYGVRKGDLQDKITREITVENGRATRIWTKIEPLNVDTVLEWPDAKNSVLVSVAPLTQIWIEQLTEQLRRQIGERLDVILSREMATSWQESLVIDANDELSATLSNYQNGGMKLLPYGDPDLRLSVLTSFTNTNWIDTNKLANYLYTQYQDRTLSREDRLIALSGLVALGEPKLLTLRNLKSESLSSKEALYLGLGALSAGDRLTAVEYFNMLNGALIKSDQALVWQDADARTQAALTWMTAALAQGVSSPEASSIVLGAINLKVDGEIITLEQALWAKWARSLYQEREAGITFRVGEERFNEQFLSSSQIWRKWMSQSELESFKVEAVNGEVSALITADVPIDASIFEKSGVNLSRAYAGQGADKTEYDLKEGEIVKIVLSYQGPELSTGCWNVTDWLPSGLEVFSDPASDWWDNPSKLYVMRLPSSRNSASFCVLPNPSSQSKIAPNAGSFEYSARVIQPGTYSAEVPVVQPLGITGFGAVGIQAKVKIIPENQ